MPLPSSRCGTTRTDSGVSVHHGRRHGQQGGFAYIEVLVSILILAIVAGAIFQGFAASSTQVGRSRLDSVSSKLAAGALEDARNLSYDDVGVVGGNPPGTIAASVDKVVNGTTYRITTTVVYVDDPAQGRPQTYVNYKKVTITVTPQVPVAKPVTASSIIAPPSYANIAGKATAVVTVVDGITLQPLQGATVTVNGSTSPTRIDSTDAQGKAVFAGLLPSATSNTSPQYYYVASATLAGYLTHPDTPPTVTRQNLTASQTWQVTIKMYRPATITVNLVDSATGQPVTERSDVGITSPAPAAVAETFTTYTGSLTTTTIGGNPILPSTTPFTVTTRTDCYADATQSTALPANYPTNTSHAFTFQLTRAPGGWLDVWVKRNGTNAAIGNATVQVSGGPNSMTPLTRTTDSNGYTRFCLPVSGSVNYTVAATASGYGSGSLPAAITLNATTPMTLLLTSGSTGTVRLKTATSNVLVRLQAVSGTYDLTQYTNSGAYADFGNLAQGNYMAYYATGFSSGNPVWSSGKAVALATTGRLDVTLP